MYYEKVTSVIYTICFVSFSEEDVIVSTYTSHTEAFKRAVELNAKNKGVGYYHIKIEYLGE